MGSKVQGFPRSWRNFNEVVAGGCWDHLRKASWWFLGHFSIARVKIKASRYPGTSPNINSRPEVGCLSTRSTIPVVKWFIHFMQFLHLYIHLYIYIYIQLYTNVCVYIIIHSFMNIHVYDSISIYTYPSHDSIHIHLINLHIWAQGCQDVVDCAIIQPCHVFYIQHCAVLHCSQKTSYGGCMENSSAF